MSYMEIYAFGHSGWPNLVSELPNAWGWSMSVWRTLEERYLPQFIPGELSVDKNMTREALQQRLGYLPTRCSDLKAVKEIWALAEDARLKKEEKIVLLATMDGALFRKEELPEVAMAFRAFGGENLLKEAADVLDEIAEDPEAEAIGFGISLITGWDGRSPGGGAYNYKSESDHFFVFDDLQKGEDFQ